MVTVSSSKCAVEGRIENSHDKKQYGNETDVRWTVKDESVFVNISVNNRTIGCSSRPVTLLLGL